MVDVMDPDGVFVTDIVRCARCGGDHSGVLVYTLSYAHDAPGRDKPTHYAKCPVSGQPILIRMLPEEAVGDPGSCSKSEGVQCLTG